MSMQVRPFCTLLIGFLAMHLLMGCGAIAGELISEHCGGAYSVTQRVDQIAWHAIDAACGGLEARPEIEPRCTFVAAGHTGFGETE